MSRIGKKPITIPDGIKVELNGNHVQVSNSKENLSLDVDPKINVKVEGSEILVTRDSDEKEVRALHGLTRSLINNMVVGLKDGYEKSLEINGTGYRAQKQGKKLIINLGYSHPIEFEEPEGIILDAPATTKITVKGADKQLVGETAARIRALRKPDPYHGHGVRYSDEVLHLKEGKTSSK
ncbi:MAG: 50S ribosomal protein L6 [Eubacteriales bacterium]|nr:50S ribosomal protein L6 [Eubacteriales bacterium]